jgi:hypothetical protein
MSCVEATVHGAVEWSSFRRISVSLAAGQLAGGHLRSFG